MQLKVLLPSRIYVDNIEVLRMVAETREGSFGILPNRLDCVAALAPGILTYQEKARAPVYLAVDAGVLVKVGSQVLVSVRHAMGGSDLGQLHDLVKSQFLLLDKQERDVRDAIVKMEGSFVGRIASLFMTDKQVLPQASPRSEETVFAAQVGVKAARKLRAQRRGDQGVWFGLGMSGLIGWSVAIPTLLGVLLGVWLDQRHPEAFSWTLTLLFAGLVLGCFNAWHWIAQQNDAMREDPEETHD